MFGGKRLGSKYISQLPEQKISLQETKIQTYNSQRRLGPYVRILVVAVEQISFSLTVPRFEVGIQDRSVLFVRRWEWERGGECTVGISSFE
jgi:hypothetical protein